MAKLAIFGEQLEQNPEKVTFRQKQEIEVLLLQRQLEGIKNTQNFSLMAEYLKQNPTKKATLRQLMSYGIMTEIAIYALLSTDSESLEAALAFIFERDEETGTMRHPYIKSDSFNPEQCRVFKHFDQTTRKILNKEGNGGDSSIQS